MRTPGRRLFLPVRWCKLRGETRRCLQPTCSAENGLDGEARESIRRE